MRATAATVIVPGGAGRTLRLWLLPAVILLSGLALRGASLPLALGLQALLAAAAAFLLHDLFGRMERIREEKCRLDEQLLQSQKLAALGELSTGLAHEINTPLAIIRQETEWMEHLLGNPPFAGNSGASEFADCLAEVMRQIGRVTEVTHNMLGFARKREPVRQETELNDLVADMLVLVEKEARNRNIAVVRDFEPDLPPLVTDSPLLRQVLLNLLNNALQAVGSDGTITVSTRQEGEACLLRVADTGPGIAPEHLDKIFNPFFTTKPPGQGTGLGLSISLAIVNRLGGTIGVDSAPGRGAVFTVRLPLAAGPTEGI